MKTEEEFKDYFETTILQQISRLKKERKNTLIFKIITIAGILIAGIIINIPYQKSGALSFSVPMSLIVGFLAYKAISYKFVDNYRQDFKNTVIKGIISFFNSSLEYDPEKSILPQAFDISGIYPTEYAYYSGSDYVEGFLGNTHIRFSWVKAEQGGNINHQIFDGLFFIANFNKNFTGDTFVFPRYLHNKMGDALEQTTYSDLPVISLEDTEFNKNFWAFSNDEIESRYILTPLFIKQIVDFNKRSEYDICFSFRRSYMFVAISLPKNIFEALEFSSEYKDFLIGYNYLNLTLDIVNDFHLNTRIWGKQD